MQLTKIISTEIDKAGRRLAKFLRFGLKDTQTALQAGPYGVDSNPIKDMIAIYSPTSEKGDTVIIGYINKNQIAGPGEYRIFSTNTNGQVQATMHLKSTGVNQFTGQSIEFLGNAKNLARYQELATAFNELKDKHNDLVNAFNSHMHATAATGPPSTPTPGVGIPAVASTADITGAKADNLKTA